MDTNLDCVTLEGAGGQTVDSRSTSGVLLKTLGQDALNELCGRLELSAQQGDKISYQVDTETIEKLHFL